MDPNNLPPFVQMLMSGTHWQEPPLNQHVILPADVPPRIKAAMEFLQRLTSKTSDKAAVHGLGCEVINGQQLSKEEILTRDAALVVLAGYFRGSLRESSWDRPLVFDPPQVVVATPLLGTTQCPVCAPGRGISTVGCGVCEGSGVVGLVKVSSADQVPLKTPRKLQKRRAK